MDGEATVLWCDLLTDGADLRPECLVHTVDTLMADGYDHDLDALFTRLTWLDGIERRLAQRTPGPGS